MSPASLRGQQVNGERDNDINLLGDEVGCKGRQPLVLSVCIPVKHRYILTFGKPKVGETLTKGRQFFCIIGYAVEVADH